MLFYGPETETRDNLLALAGQKQKTDYTRYDALNRIDAVVSLDFKNELHYAGDSLIGYHYVIDVKGRLLDFDVIKKYGHNFPDKIKRMQRMTKLLNQQGLALFYTDEEHNILLTARGCQLKSLSFDEEAGWVNSIPYSFQMIASEMNFFTQELATDGIIKKTYAEKLVGGKDFKIKDFSDNITYNFDEDIFKDIHQLDPETPDPSSPQTNLLVKFSCDISAVGMNYTVNEDGELIPAWEQARLFCQDRLKYKIGILAGSLNGRFLSIDKAATSCNATRPLDSLYADNGVDSNAILDRGMSFGLYNEELTTTASESDGSFNVRYSAILKRGDSPFIHRISKSLEHGETSSSKKYVVKGTVEGLVKGGLFFGADYGAVKFPANGYFLVSASGIGTVNSKFDNAQLGFDTLTKVNETDLNDATKDWLGITHTVLTNPDGDTIFCGSFSDAYPRANSFTVQKNWNEGTIEWTAEFDSSTDCAQEYTSIEFSINREVPVITNLVIPNGSTITPMNTLGIGHRLVYIGTTTNPTMDVTIKGTDHTQRYCCLGAGAGGWLTNFMNASNGPVTLSPSIYAKLPDLNNAILTRSTKNLNINTGDYIINLSYILCTPGCYITQGL